jgi:hypothetical protein
VRSLAKALSSRSTRGRWSSRVIYIVLSMTSCNEEAVLALKEGAGLCHSIGSYCSSCIRILGSCVSCIEHDRQVLLQLDARAHRQ